MEQIIKYIFFFYCFILYLKNIFGRVSSVMVSIIDCGSIDPCSIHGLPRLFFYFIF